MEIGFRIRHSTALHGPEGVLASLDLSLAYPTVSVGYVLVVLMSRAIFKERVTPARWVAVVMIFVGVALVGLGSS